MHFLEYKPLNFEQNSTDEMFSVVPIEYKSASIQAMAWYLSGAKLPESMLTYYSLDPMGEPQRNLNQITKMFFQEDRFQLVSARKT